MSNILSGTLEILPYELTNILSQNYHLFYYKRGEDEFAIYMAENEIPLKNLDKSISYINFTINYEEKEATIIDLRTNANYTKLGIAHYLLIIVAYICYNQGINKILLDDDSDFAHKGSVYEKVGCRYINEYPEPEMECSSKTILDKYNKFLEKYVNQKSPIFYKSSIYSTLL